MKDDGIGATEDEDAKLQERMFRSVLNSLHYDTQQPSDLLCSFPAAKVKGHKNSKKSK